jgi:hypothetical protein
MSRCRRAALVAFAVVALAQAPAWAAVLASATWVESVGGVPIAVPVLATGTSTQTSVSVSLVVPAFEISIETPVASMPTPFFGTRVFLRGPGDAVNLHVEPGMATASLAVRQTAGILGRLTAAPIEVPWSYARFAPGRIRCRLGCTQAPSYGYFALLGHGVSVLPSSFGWIAGATTLTGLTREGLPAPDAKAQGSFALDAFGAGTVTLVAPRRIWFDSSFAPANRTIGSFTTLTLHFVPEPGALVLLGAAGAVALARRRLGCPTRGR